MVNREAKRDVTVSKDALLKSYSKRLKDDVRSLADNFSAIVKTCRFSGMKTIWHFYLYFPVNVTHSNLPFLNRVEEEHQVCRSTQAEEDALEMQVGEGPTHCGGLT